MAVFDVKSERSDRNAVLHIDEIAQYQTRKCINSNEFVWRILPFPIHELCPADVHLIVHLENGQGVYFTAANIQQIAPNPPATTINLQRSVDNDGKHLFTNREQISNQLAMPSPNRSAAASFDIELHRKQNYNTTDLFSYVQSNIPKLTFEQKGIYDQIMRTVNEEVGKIFLLDAPG
ncbi:unnamed protein product [Onchocerca ochengi]|uniref:ATP-dependent DNA helicase n=1 Tax=Onchocerca ochengi TaxID=42157 RepID=A0A182EA50_ONCOC|nr:unnamed protein product [Onchocerca ochengi]